MTKRKLIAQLRECAEDVDRKPIWLYRRKHDKARDFACQHMSMDEAYFTHPIGAVLLLLILADMLAAE